jgi:predicted ATPase with chaperone activity
MASRTQQVARAHTVGIEAFYFAVRPAQVQFAVQRAAPAAQASAVDDTQEFAGMIVGWPDELAQETLQRLYQAIRAAGASLAAGFYVLHVHGTTWDGGGRFDAAMALALIGAGSDLDTEHFHAYHVFGALNARGELCAPRESIFAAASLRTDVPNGGGPHAVLVPAETAGDFRELTDPVLCYFETLKQLYECVQRKINVWHFQKAKHLPKVKKAPARPRLHLLQTPSHVKEMLTIAAAGNHSLLVRDDCGGQCAWVLSECLAAAKGPLDKYAAIRQARYAVLSKAGLSLSQWQQHRCYHIDAGNSQQEIFGQMPTTVGLLSAAYYGVLVLNQPQNFAPEILERLQACLQTRELKFDTERGRLELPVAGLWMLALPAREPPALSRALLDRCAFELNFGANDLQFSGKQKDAKQFANVEEQIQQARYTQQVRTQRLPKVALPLNGELSGEELQALSPLPVSTRNALDKASEREGWSVLKRDAVHGVARTIADLGKHEKVELADMHRAIILCSGTLLTYEATTPLAPTG